MLQTRRWATAAAALVSIALPGVAAGATLKVPGDFATIQACIDAAVSGVDECVAAPGTYHETINFLGKAITLRSSDGADVTTIDATGIGGSVVTCATGEGPDTILDGFTITGGTGTDVYGNGSTYGGGMYNNDSSPTVANCTFIGNTANNGGGMYNYFYSSPTVNQCTFAGNTGGGGGGMFNHDDSSPTVTNCTFSGNTAVALGAGMYNYHSSPVLTRCTFSENSTTGWGGGMYNVWYSGPTVTDCVFSRNAGFGGGGMGNSDSNPLVADCTFSRNTSGYGAGMNNNNSDPIVTRCAFIGNAANNRGGGMLNHASNLTVADCIFAGNTATAWGGGVYNSGGRPTFLVCMFRANTATYGGGIFNFSPKLTVANCTFSANAGNYGGGIFNAVTGSAALTDCILWGDSPDEVGSDEPDSAPAIRFSDVQGGLPVGTVDGGGNIDLDPLFIRPPDPGPDGTWDGVDDDYGDLRLQAGSPCVDAGDPAFVSQPGETDLEGHARVLCGRVDMGAYEFGIGDHDCDQVVDLADFSSWQACMTAPRDVRELALAALTGPAVQSAIDIRQSTIGCEAFDFDGDGDVDLLDFGGFQRIFGP